MRIPGAISVEPAEFCRLFDGRNSFAVSAGICVAVGIRVADEVGLPIALGVSGLALALVIYGLGAWPGRGSLCRMVQNRGECPQNQHQAR